METKEFESLASRIRHGMLSMARRMLRDDEADDAVQEALMRLWLARNRLSQVENPDGFAMQACRHICLDLLRKKGRSPVETTDELPNPADCAPGADEIMISRETDVAIDSIFSRLSPSQSVIIRLRHVEGLSTAEMAAITGSSEGAVRLSLSRARKNVASIFKTIHNIQ